MDVRVTDLLGEAARGVSLGTFHAICAKILRREAEHLPFEANFVIFDSDDQEKLVKAALEDLNLDEKRFRPQAVHGSISNAKNELILPDDYKVLNYRDEVVKKVYERYQQMLLANNALDFDDLLLWTAILLEQNPIVREKYARRYEHVLVDEFQDTNMAQYLLLKHLASFHRNVFVVGDVDQAIYRWRGADYRNVLRFEEDYPDTQIILLEQNYRSTQDILNVAMAVIDKHPYRKPKKLRAQRGGGQKVFLHECYDDQAEAEFVIDTIATQVARQGAKSGDFAVMYRTNAQSRVLEEAFLHANLPYKLVGAQRFYGRREIKDVIAYLRLVHNPNDELSLTRVINMPPRGIGEKTLLAVRTEAQKANLSPGQLILALANEESPYHTLFSGRTLAALLKFSSHLAAWRAELAEAALSPLLLMDRILNDIAYRDYVDDSSEEGKDRWDNVMELRRLATEYQGQPLETFLERVALVSDQDTVESGANVPTLLTLHAAKGLEFPVVFLVGLNDGTLPHQRSFDDPEAMHEERRLLYVGITRAKDKLYMVHPQNRSQYGYAESVEPSRFLADIPDDLLDDSAPRRSSGRRRSKGADTVDEKPLAAKTGAARWSAEPAKSAPPASSTPKTGQPASGGRASSSRTSSDPVGSNHAGSSKSAGGASDTPRFPAGSKVLHPTYGEGMVLNNRLQDGDEIVDIFFEQYGMKRVLASLAKLVKQ